MGRKKSSTQHLKVLSFLVTSFMNILSKDNIDSIFTKLVALFKNGEYGTNGEYFEPQVTITPLSGEDFPAGLRITVSTSSFGFNTIHIPYGAMVASSEIELLRGLCPGVVQYRF